ncbi:MAG: hypothetical protein GY909_16955 [Oligoflexia bacterium]|nr:hypothetical protein [Oligoflexia bacterium]
MKAILTVLTFFLVGSNIFAAKENCEVKIKKFCPGNEKSCVQKNMKVIGNECTAFYFYENHTKVKKDFDVCLEKLQKFCGKSSSEQCFEENKNRLTSSCQKTLADAFDSRKKKPKLSAGATSCMGKVMKKCKFDMELMRKDHQKATSSYMKCIQDLGTDMKKLGCNDLAKEIEVQKKEKNIQVIQ